VQRVGRTARAEKTGVAITLINQKEIRSFKRIEGFIGTEVQKLPLPKNLGDGPAYEASGKQDKQRGKPFKKRRPGKFHKKRKPHKS
jgi:superfamily II DNA/RNA helicase